MSNQSSDVEVKESFVAHTAVIAGLQELINDVGESSNLILDPVLDSYYLVDAAVLKLPALIENLGQARGLGTGIAARQTADPNEKSRLIALSTLFLENHGAVERGMDVVFERNASVKSDLATRLEESIARLKTFLDVQWNELIAKEPVIIAPSSYFAAATAAIEAQLALYDAILPMLDRLLEARISTFDGKNHLVIAIAGATGLLSVYLFTAFYLSVRRRYTSSSGAAGVWPPAI